MGLPPHAFINVISRLQRLDNEVLKPTMHEHRLESRETEENLYFNCHTTSVLTYSCYGIVE